MTRAHELLILAALFLICAALKVAAFCAFARPRRGGARDRGGRMTCKIGDGVIVCSAGPWRVRLNVECPWCQERRRCLAADVFGGWCGQDYMCGTCGSYWDSESGTVRKLTEEQREKYIAEVAATPDPQCWDCHDRGWLPMSPVSYEPESCECLAGIAAAKQCPDCGGDPAAFCCEGIQ